jgi:hypothetical protein
MAKLDGRVATVTMGDITQAAFQAKRVNLLARLELRFSDGSRRDVRLVTNTGNVLHVELLDNP